jgi:hypothetical protein
VGRVLQSGCVVAAAHLGRMLGVALVHLHVHVLIAVFGGIDAHVERLRLFPRKVIFSAREQHAPPISLNKLKIVWGYRRRARRFAGLHYFRRLRESDRLEDEIAY